MYQFLVLHSLSIDQTLGQQFPGVTEPPGKMMCWGIKYIFCQCSLWNPMRSLSRQANHLDFNKPFGYLLVWCNLSAWSSFAAS